MTLLEKVNITSGIGWEQGLCVGNTAPAVHVNFPALCLQDGPLGIRFADNATAFPAGITVGATWNRELMRKRGELHALEAKAKGVNVLLGPSMGPIGRTPLGGRNWEGFGSDPYLQGVAAAETIKGIQGAGVIATAKHFILNEQEHFRQIMEWEKSRDEALSSNVDDRTIHELYLWPFADAVRAGVGAVMCSYNRVNQTYACGNSDILNGLLKSELGFQGFVMSDWFAQRTGFHSVLSGLDMDMPGEVTIFERGQTLFASNLTTSVMNSSIPLERLDDMATRIVASWYQMGQDDPKNFPVREPNFSSWSRERTDVQFHGASEGPEVVVNQYVDVREDHDIVARQVAAEGVVLVKNIDAILPLSRSSLKKAKLGIYGEDAGDENQPGFPNFCTDRGCNRGSLAMGWGSGAVELETFSSPQSAIHKELPNTKITAITDNTRLEDISKSAEEQDICIVFINSAAGEGFITDPVTGAQGDRIHLYPQKNGDELVKTVAESCEAAIVILHTVGPVILDRWISHPSVKALLIAHLPGQESGSSLTPLLFGDISPSGKLPYTIAKQPADYGKAAAILEEPNAIVPQQTFEEGLLIDYRHFDYYNITPQYEFGFGLSYTTFNVKNINIIPVLEKSEFPPPPPALLPAPKLNSTLPKPEEVVFPKGWRKIRNYFYPYVNSVDDINSPTPLDPPKGYTTKPHPPSPAGGGEGGNPSLWDVMLEVEFTLSNTGDRPGKEVVQLYVEFPALDGEEEVRGNTIGKTPKRVLRGFEKIALGPGEQTTVKLPLMRRDLSYWDVEAQNWRMALEGKYRVGVGASSRKFWGWVEY
ncbi:hypothetical protein EX30DRAFT_80217 [Ascodesmis nigricans]|uniref:beta-glucosidase n=1 Tax=Ascodesmis nigricans TaxID=341454 RepID=A0A4V3SID7_9PEZI|nr:hypothetical protein EX30DRAFT_80217 [Ascodesmis nigricans]